MFNPRRFAWLVCFWAVAAQAQWTARMSVDSYGNQTNDHSYTYTETGGGCSAGGKRVVFHSAASNLVWNDTNGQFDIFLRDRLNKFTYRVSVDSSGNEGNGLSQYPVINADGRYVAFESYATNLAPNDVNGGFGDVFLHDTWSGSTILVSRAFGVPGGGSGNNASYNPTISADGRFVAFHSYASNLVANDLNGFFADVFVFDMQTGVMKLVSVDSQGNQTNEWSATPSISGDGRYITFSSLASNLVVNDNNNAPDIFVHDQQTGMTRRVSVDGAGGEAHGGSVRPNISEDGQFVAFESNASNLVLGDTNGVFDVFVKDLLGGVIDLVSRNDGGDLGNEYSWAGRLSRHGRYVVFMSYADNLVPKDTNMNEDVFVFDRSTNLIGRVSVSTGGWQSVSGGFYPSIDASGRFVLFSSGADNLVAGDTNYLFDVFLHQRSRTFAPDGSLD